METMRSAMEEPSFQGCNIIPTDLARPMSTYLHMRNWVRKDCDSTCHLLCLPVVSQTCSLKWTRKGRSWYSPTYKIIEAFHGICGIYCCWKQKSISHVAELIMRLSCTPLWKLVNIPRKLLSWELSLLVLLCENWSTYHPNCCPGNCHCLSHSQVYLDIG